MANQDTFGSDTLSPGRWDADATPPCAADALRSAGRAENALVGSTEPIEVFTSVADAMLQCGAAEVSVELIDHEAVTRVVRQSPADGTGPVRAEALLPQTQQLFAGGGEPIIDGPLLAVPIRSNDVLPFVETAPGPDFIGSLVCRFDAPGPSAYDQEMARLLVRRAVSVVHQQRQDQALRRRATNLETALSTNREIATAIGIVMATRRLSSEGAFAWLRDRSQTDNRKLRDIANEVVAAGETAA